MTGLGVSLTSAIVHARASDVLHTLLGSWPSSHIAIGDLTKGFGDRSISLLILLGSLPNCVPGPPGVGSALGLLTLIGSIQLMLLRRTLWLPAALLSPTIPVRRTLGLVERAIPRLAWIENVCSPRAGWVFSRAGKQMIGCYLVVLSICVLIPVPLTNFVPAFGSALIALGLVEKDGFVVILGAVVGAIGLLLATSAVGILTRIVLGGIG